MSIELKLQFVVLVGYLFMEVVYFLKSKGKLYEISDPVVVNTEHFCSVFSCCDKPIACGGSSVISCVNFVFCLVFVD